VDFIATQPKQKNNFIPQKFVFFRDFFFCEERWKCFLEKTGPIPCSKQNPAGQNQKIL